MLSILDNGWCIENGDFCYTWYKVSDEDGYPYFRCVALKQLDTIPVADRDDYNLLGKMWGAMRGIYNANVNLVVANAGIFRPEHIGLVQYFGAAGEGPDKDTAAENALRGMATVEGVMANFHQSKLVPPNKNWLRWYLEFISDHGHFIAALLGHPDPREGRGAGTKDGAIGDASKDELSMEQNEILFRGLAKIRQNFVFQVLAEHVARPQLTKTLMSIAEMTSAVASRRRGSINIGFSLGIPLMAAVGQSLAGSQGASLGASQGVSQSSQHSWGLSHQTGQAHTESESVTHTEGSSTGQSSGQSVMDTSSHSVTESSSTSTGVNEFSGGNWNFGVSIAPADVGIKGGGGGSWGSGTSESVSHGTAVSDGTAHSVGTSQSQSVNQMVSDSVSHGSADTQSESWGENDGYGQGIATSIARSQALNQALMHGVSSGINTGLLPGINIGRSWQTEDDVADRLTEVLRKLEGLVNTASAEGGFMANALIFTETMNGASAADALAPQAFHGPDVATPVLTIAPLEGDENELRTHALAFVPWRGGEDNDPLNGSLWTRYATLLTAEQAAALTAPALFEEGVAATVMSPIPHGMGFIPNMPGNVVIGHQYSPETADLTTAQVRLSPEMFMHTLYAGDTGFGKSVAAIRTVYETTRAWNWRTIVLDFGAGWRQLLNAPGLEGRVNILQLWPDAVRPMRWNPLQIGRNIAPETQWRAFADVFGSITQLGVKRQKQELLEALRICYIRTGVLIDDPQVRADPQWGKVRTGEESDLISAVGGSLLSTLTTRQRQVLAVYRSSVVGLADLYAEIEAKRKDVPPRDTMLTGVLDGILFRMNPLVQGAAAVQFSPGKDCVPVEDLSKPNGITIIEGGMFLDEFGKAFLLGWVGWHTYMDRVATRVHEVHMTEPMLHIVYEEANKIFGQQPKGSSDDGGGSDISDQYGAQFRDARKYGVRFSVIAQAPSLIAPDIISSCSNLVINYLKNPKDKDIALSALARSEKGFRDEEWRRFIDDMSVGMAIGRFPYVESRKFQRPVLLRPLMLDVPEPTDDEISAKLGKIVL